MMGGVDETVLGREDYEAIEGLNDLVEAYGEAGVDLEPGILRRAGHALRRRDGRERELREAYRTAKREWWTLNRERPGSYEDGELPGDAVEVGGTEYVVHGINHGLGRRVYTISDEVRELLDAELSAYLDKGEPIYVEQGLTGHVSEHVADRAGVEELDDIEWAAEKDVWGLLKAYGKGLAKLSFHIPAMEAAGRFGGRSDRPSIDMMHTLGRARTDPGSLADLHNVVKSYYLPVDLEEDYAEAFRPGWGTLTVGRSRYQAREAVRRTYRLDDAPDRVHLLVGAGHQPHIVDELEGMDEALREQLEKEGGLEDALPGVGGIEFAQARQERGID